MNCNWNSVKLVNALNIQPQGGFIPLDDDMAFEGGNQGNAANRLF